MKRFALLSSLFVVLTCGFSSCSKCYVCDFGNGDVQERCSDRKQGGVDALELTIEDFEKQGYICTKK
ncbi:MAG: hypothetical protein V4615_16620 [Bacteroidota bacterium]